MIKAMQLQAFKTMCQKIVARYVYANFIIHTNIGIQSTTYSYIYTEFPLKFKRFADAVNSYQ